MGTLVIGVIVAIGFTVAIVQLLKNKKNGGCSGCSGCSTESSTNEIV
ncbi:MAG: FeoB-associated Cys-rich membrane protein [Oscillospiraceae bacterium]